MKIRSRDRAVGTASRPRRRDRLEIETSGPPRDRDVGTASRPRRRDRLETETSRPPRDRDVETASRPDVEIETSSLHIISEMSGQWHAHLLLRVAVVLCVVLALRNRLFLSSC